MQSVALIGRGRIGGEIAAALRAGRVPGLDLIAVLGRSDDPVPAITRATIVVEAASAAVVPALARLALPAGKTLVVTSAAGLWHETMPPIPPGRVVVPSGATLGLDALKAMARQEIRSARVVMRLPPDHAPGEVGAFRGGPRQAARRFPGHANNLVATALALGREVFEVEMLIDPAVPGPLIEVEALSDTAHLRASLGHFPAPGHPEVSRNIALSVLAALESLVAPLRIGS
ncbi:MAG: DUF108 domain-containing protein [Alphaproteobacteria bacterium]|nr:DUF108 domain-containing protein [Alphaproteobacteria bacterium]